MLEALCFFLGAVFLAMAGHIMIDGIARGDIRLKINALFTLLISGLWMIIGIYTSYYDIF